MGSTFYILLNIYLQISVSYSSVTEVKVGVLLMTSAPEPFDLRRIGPALDIAFEQSEARYGIKYNVFVHNYTEGTCPRQTTIGHYAELAYQQNIQAVIGPACSQSLDAVGRLAQYLKMPIISGVGDLIIRTGPEMYTTLTRTCYNLGKFSTSIMGLMREYSWQHIAVIYDVDYIFFELAGGNLVRDFHNDASFPRPLDLQFQASKLADPGSLLIEASKEARFLVIFCDAELLRTFMYRAFQLGMASGGYVFLTMELFPSDWLGYYTEFIRGDYMDEGVTKAYESVLILTLSQPNTTEYNAFADEVKMRALRDYNYDFGEQTVNYFVTAFYEGVLYLSEAFNRTLADGQNITDGLAVAQKLWNNTYPGISGTVAIDEVGDRRADFDFLDMTNPSTRTFRSVGTFIGSSLLYVPVPGVNIHWPNGLPLDEPACGYVGEKCIPKDNNSTLILAVSFICIILVAAVITFFVYRKLKFDSEIGKKTWLIPWDDVKISKNDQGGSVLSKSRISMLAADGKIDDIAQQQLFTAVGHCKGNIVAIRNLKCYSIDLTRSVLMEFHQLQSLHHQNLARFTGACIEPRKCAILMEYCPRGSLQDIIENDDINLDWTFRYSLIWDIIRGMQYIQNSALKYHGRLSSTNCVIDSRFMLKLTDFGIPTVFHIERLAAIKANETNQNKLLWTAPEILRSHDRILQSPLIYQKGDTYSFGIILQEIVIRGCPFDEMDYSTDEIIKKVQSHPDKNVPFRPIVPVTSCSKELHFLMQTCWSEESEDRPNFDTVASSFKKINSGTKGNIMDNLMKRMEQYANNLESLVQERTNAYLEEKKKAVELLHRLLPPSVADQLEAGNQVLPETYKCVTIYFSDIVGFTTISAMSTPLEVIALLNELYTAFDTIIDKFDVYKVETIGDAYMVVSGLPRRNGDKHAEQIASMACEIRQAVLGFKIRHLPEETLKIRIGLHSGTVVAGVVGLTMPRYCLFGDTVNTASRMESTSEALRIHISNPTKVILDKFNKFWIEDRGEINVKGKGMMNTYWLNEPLETLLD
ncbi:atrial natriuretic peptide receptor 1-like [Ylistrum balloti]|uniref:atrial natriuretic peptide receptor 1-like n=1 Tax=Ylistrum balloti TaxID=509963 RepID=UPI002905F59D|nr:atrial natriuretic peptide receptor 1-like [Ylistrum balloti]